MKSPTSGSTTTTMLKAWSSPATSSTRAAPRSIVYPGSTDDATISDNTIVGGDDAIYLNQVTDFVVDNNDIGGVSDNLNGCTSSAAMETSRTTR